MLARQRAGVGALPQQPAGDRATATGGVVSSWKMKQRPVLRSLELQHPGRSETKASALLWVNALPSLQTASEALLTASQLSKNPRIGPCIHSCCQSRWNPHAAPALKDPLISVWVMPHSRVKIAGQPVTKERGGGHRGRKGGQLAIQAVRAGATDLKDSLASA